MSNDLLDAKQRLASKLGVNYTSYIQLIGQWFRGYISKEVFDERARELIDRSLVADHNKFWLAFYHHCANNTGKPSHSRAKQNQKNTKDTNQKDPSDFHNTTQDADSSLPNLLQDNKLNSAKKVKCLPNRLLTRMKIIVIAWEMGLDFVNDRVSFFVDLALKQFLKNIIAEMISVKTAYRIRENRFKHAFGVKAINPFLQNSTEVFNANLEIDPYKVKANKMSISLVDTYAYNDSLFPSRLREGQAVYEIACATTSFEYPSPDVKTSKRIKLTEVFVHNEEEDAKGELKREKMPNERTSESHQSNQIFATRNESKSFFDPLLKDIDSISQLDSPQTCDNTGGDSCPDDNFRRLTLQHLYMAICSEKSLIPSKSLCSSSLERIVTKIPY